jgi:YD repeat-containing protein
VPRPIHLVLLLTSISIAALFASSASALERNKDGWYHTGAGVRVKEIAFIDVDVYEIHHYTKELPAKRSKQAMIELDVDKKLEWKMLRDVEAEKMRTALESGYEMNGFKEKAKIAKFTGAFQREMKEGSKVTIAYDALGKTTTITVQGGGTASVEGADFMRATWSVWFGKIDQSSLGDAMIKALP